MEVSDALLVAIMFVMILSIRLPKISTLPVSSGETASHPKVLLAIRATKARAFAHRVLDLSGLFVGIDSSAIIFSVMSIEFPRTAGFPL